MLSGVFLSLHSKTKRLKIITYVTVSYTDLTHLDAIFLISYSSKLTLGILKRRYLAHVRCESLSPEARNFMKKVVQEELMKMQVSDSSYTVYIVCLLECFGVL